MPTRGLINPELLTGIADAIRAKNGTSAGMTPAQMAAAISNLELSEAIKQALLNCFAHVAWIDDQGQTYYDALEDALYPTAPPAELLSISAVFEQGQTVIYDTDSLDDLKPMLTVTAHYSDSTSAEVTTYTLSGTLTVGTSTITVEYSGKTTTFDVVVSELVVETGYIEIGSPNISNNILTTSSSGSVRTKSVFSPGSSPWKIRVGFTNTDSTSGYKDVFGTCNSSGTSQYGILLEKSSNYGTFLSGNGSSWNIANAEMAFAKNTNVPVVYELEFTGTVYRVRISTDGGQTFGEWLSKSSSASIKGGNYIGFGISRNGYHAGTINLAECMIWIDGQLWWKAVA